METIEWTGSQALFADLKSYWSGRKRGQKKHTTPLYAVVVQSQGSLPWLPCANTTLEQGKNVFTKTPIVNKDTIAIDRSMACAPA